MSIEKIELGSNKRVGIKIVGKLTTADWDAYAPQIESAVSLDGDPIRLLIEVNEMTGAELKAEWEIFGSLKKHFEDIEYIAIVGAHSWAKVMSEVLAESIFVQAETRYFEENELDDAKEWLKTSAHPSHVPVRRVINSPDGLFTKYGSPNFM